LSKSSWEGNKSNSTPVGELDRCPLEEKKEKERADLKVINM